MKLRPILSLIVLFGGLAFLLLGSVPGLLSDLQHRSDFRPAQAAEITEADCTNWNYAMLHQGTVKIRRAANGPEEKLEEWAFGRAPDAQGRLLEAPGEPRAFTTDAAMNELTGRIIFVVVLVAATILFVVGLGLRLARARQPAAA
jgi:hypothetical protein